MNRKNTILIAVGVNVGLLAVLLIAALTVQEDQVPMSPAVVQTDLQLPRFDEHPVFADLPQVVHSEELKLPDMPVLAKVEEEPIIHKLPPLVVEATPAPVDVKSSTPIKSENRASEIIVKKGDTLERIARANQTTVDEILKLNHLPSSFLKIGQVLKLPYPKGEVKKAVEVSPEYYTMKVGDNPWAVALKHHMKVEELLRLNGLNEERARKLKPGDRLRTR